MTGSTEGAAQRIAELEATVDGLRQLVLNQSRRLEALERGGVPDAGGVTIAAAPAGTVLSRPDTISTVGGLARRRLLIGSATAAASAAAAVLATSSPAAAGDGDPVVMGTGNTATNMTTVTVDLDGYPVINAVNEGDGAALQGSNVSTTIAAIRGVSTGAPGVYGASTSDSGVYGSSESNNGVSGRSTSAHGVYGVSIENIGVLGQSGAYAGVMGTCNTGYGVRGSGGGVGVHGYGLVGLEAESSNVNVRLTSPANRTAPTGDASPHERGDLVLDGQGDLWVCVVAGTPGTWRKLSGPGAAGTFHLLPQPVRVYDSRPGTTPAVGSKTKLSGNTSRLLAVTANSSGVPLGATAVAVTLLLVNASSAGGNFTVWAGGSTRPSANAMVWGGNAGRFASTATTRISATGEVNVAASSSTDLALDVVGYYR